MGFGFNEGVGFLRDELLEEPPRQYVDDIASGLLEKIYSSKNVSHLNANDFFFLLTAKVLYSEMGETDTNIINYLSDLLGEQTLRVESILKEKDLKLYDSFLKNISLEDSSPEASKVIGDLCLFNSGILRNHHDNEYSILMKKWFFDPAKKKRFEEGLAEIGIESYRRACSFEKNGVQAEIFGKMHTNFSDYSEGLNTIASRYIYKDVA